MEKAECADVQMCASDTAQRQESDHFRNNETWSKAPNATMKQYHHSHHLSTRREEREGVRSRRGEERARLENRATDLEKKEEGDIEKSLSHSGGPLASPKQKAAQGRHIIRPIEAFGSKP
mmetsp:Transcript_84721/g.177177  ORF Transcript_84721/g.177177 Transcript_84721/m.177177 type:complete len:120 (+) Transcript_84721:363-722(+)